MKRIGILTFSRALNYGALFQAYALKEFLKNEEIIVEIIDYWPKYHQESYKFFSPVAFKKQSIKGKVKYLLGFIIGSNRIIKRRRGYLKFITNKLGINESIKYEEGHQINQDYDLVIYGSDQIWRKIGSPLFEGFDNVYFGSHPIRAKKKITYAASMGIISLNDGDKIQLTNLLKNFNALGIREVDLQVVVKDLGYESQLVLDPVFLLNRNQWFKLIEGIKRSEKKERYILIYDLLHSKNAVKLAESIGKQRDCKLKIVLGTVNPYLIGEKYVQTATPEEFLSLIWNAEFIITTSFHGTSFSVLFEKQFLALDMGKNSQRTRTLLNLLSIEDRYIEDFEDISSIKEIDYTPVRTKLEALTNTSKEYLKSSLES